MRVCDLVDSNTAINNFVVATRGSPLFMLISEHTRNDRPMGKPTCNGGCSQLSIL